MKRVFICHAPEQDSARKSLIKHMAMMTRQGLLSIVEDVGSTDIALVLLSPDMLIHDRAWAESEALRRRQLSGQCRLIPVMVEPLATVPDHLALLVSLPRHGGSVRGDVDWAAIAGEIRAIALKDVL